MARFIFRMQSILNIKEKLEEQAKMEFAGAKMKLDEEEEKLDHLHQRKFNFEEEGRRLRKDHLRVRDILDNKNAILRMDEYIAVQLNVVRRAEALLEEARIKLQESIQERKTYERLHEKAFEEFMKEENARESKEVDELTSYVHGKKRSSV